MVVFFPFQKPVNPFLDEIEPYFDGEFIFDHYYNSHLYKNIDVVHLHWPEILFDSKLPTENQIQDFKLHFTQWKAKYKIAYTFHNLKPHTSSCKHYKDLYKFIALNVNVVVHFGKTSIIEFKKSYSESLADNVVIEHPLYLNTSNNVTQKTAKAYFGLNLKAKVVLVFGEVRTRKEQKLILQTFKKLRIRKKVLLVPTMRKFRLKNDLGWKIAAIYNKLRFTFFNLKLKYILSNSVVDSQQIQYYFNAADVVFIPRTNALNSGVLYMAARFNKKIVAPSTGNIGEVAESLKQKTFKTHDTNAISNAIKETLIDENPASIYEMTILKMHPKNVAQKHFELYNSLVE